MESFTITWSWLHQFSRYPVSGLDPGSWKLCAKLRVLESGFRILDPVSRIMDTGSWILDPSLTVYGDFPVSRSAACFEFAVTIQLPPSRGKFCGASSRLAVSMSVFSDLSISPTSREKCFLLAPAAQFTWEMSQLFHHPAALFNTSFRHLS